MNARSLSRITIIALVALGSLFVLLRRNARTEYQVAQENSFWRVTYEIRFKMRDTGIDKKAELRVAIPNPNPPAALIDDDFTAPELESIVWGAGSLTGTREYRFFARNSKDYTVTAKFDINTRANGDDDPLAMESLSPDARSRFLRNAESGPRVQDRAQAIPETLRSVEERIEWIFEDCLGLRATTPEEGGTDIEMALATGQASPLGRVKAFVAICRAAKIPARLVTGFELRRVESPQPHVWAEVFRNNRWVPFDPEYGFARQMPASFVPVRRGGSTIVETKGAEITSERYTIERLPPPEEVLLHDTRQPLQIFDLTRLPLEMHEVLKLVLLLPLGALITAFFRNVIGIRTFGTFAPSLLAMSFIYAAFGTGLALLIVAVLAGLAGRTLLERLHLLMVPRLSFVLTVIILCMVLGVSLVDYMASTPQPQAVLLPLVILTIIIERFYVTSEEDGFPFAVQLAVGTLVVATFCYLILKWDDIGRLILTYPEAHLFTLAAFVFIGRYTGYRVTELWRFRDVINNRDQQP